MKKLLTHISILLLLGLITHVNGQEFKHDKGSTKLVNISQVSGKIVLSEYTGSSIIVTAEGYKKKNVPEKAKGLRQINSNGIDNTNLGLYMTQRGDALEFMSVDMLSEPVTYFFKVPKGMAVKIDNSKIFHHTGGYFPALEAREIAKEARIAAKEAQIAAREASKEASSRVFTSGDMFFSAKPDKPERPDKGGKNKEVENGVEVKSFSGELEIKTMISGIDLKDVTGPLTINSMSGPINIEFSTVNQSAPITITSYSAEIDITMPSNTKANLKMSSMNGDIYTDFDIKFKEDKETRGLRYIGGGSNISGTINGGGVDVLLKALSDNIYLRKK
jgi:hypothetical protein